MADSRNGDYRGVPTADLAVIHRALTQTPAARDSAVLARVRAELDRRPRADRERAEEVTERLEFKRRDKVLVRFPALGLAETPTAWCLVEYVMATGELVVLDADGRRHAVDQDRVVEHVVADLRA